MYWTSGLFEKALKSPAMKAVNRIGTSQTKKPGRKRRKKWLYNYDDGDIGDNDNSDKTLMLMVVMVARSWQKKNYEFLPKIECAIWYPEKRRLFPCQKKEKDDRSKPMKRTKTGHKDKLFSVENNKLTTRALCETNTSWYNFLSPRYSWSTWSLKQ